MSFKYIKQRFLPAVTLACFYLFRIFPLRNKVVGTTMRGRKYDDNPKYILERIHELMPDASLVWLHDMKYAYDLPAYVKSVPYYGGLWSTILRTFHLCTAKVWVNSHHIESFMRKRKGQTVVQTWHGGIAIKKLEGDVEKVRNHAGYMKELRSTCQLSDVFISNSDQITDIYRRAFQYKGPILKCGYPRSDVFFRNNSEAREKMEKTYGVSPSERVVLYAPTFRDTFDWDDPDCLKCYDIAVDRLRTTFQQRFGGRWKVMVRWHPVWINQAREHGMTNPQFDIDATPYPDMQELLCAVDGLVTDYSSCIFDASLRKIPCFTFATDFEAYKSERGTYFEMEDLPFPCAHNNDELMQNILDFDQSKYETRLEEFATRIGIKETGHASDDIAQRLVSLMKGEKTGWQENTSVKNDD